MKKASNKLKNNYVVVQSWMVNELGLKGNRLIIYAIIYGFSQTEKQLCTCDIEYLQAWTNSTKQGVLNTLDSLEFDGLIERVKIIGGDKRKTAYRIIGQQSLPINTQIGKESLPNLESQIGKESLPNSEKKVKKVYLNRSTKFTQIGQQSCRATDNNKNNNKNIYTDLSVSHSAGAREDETDGQTEKEFYAECILNHWNKLKIELWGEDALFDGWEYEKRLNDVVSELKRRDSVAVNGKELSATEMLKTINELFADVSAEKLLSALVSGCAPEIKKKFNYTVTALYNAAKQF